MAKAWTSMAVADAELMGDYEGEWIDAPRGHYFDINKPVAAQIINVRDGEYVIRIFQEHDRRADPYYEGRGRVEDAAIVFSSDGWSGRIGKEGMVGSGQRDGKTIAFATKRVERSSRTLGAKPPQGAVVLFDGKNLDQWQHEDGRPVSWNILDDGAFEVRSARSNEDRKNGIGGDIRTKADLGDYHLHLEFRYPVEPGLSGQGRGNSGLFLQGNYEVQILNSYGLAGNWNECGALYKVMPPQVNAARPPGQWQTYDIDYQASVWKGGQKTAMPRITVRLNGVLVHTAEEIPYATAHALKDRANEPKGPAPIRLQDHGHPIQFRNIWLVPGKD